MQVTSEEYAAAREELRAIDARPVKKVMEAKARKQKRLRMRLTQVRGWALPRLGQEYEGRQYGGPACRAGWQLETWGDGEQLRQAPAQPAGGLCSHQRVPTCVPPACCPSLLSTGAAEGRGCVQPGGCAAEAEDAGD